MQIEEAIQEEKDVVAEVRNRLKENNGKVEGESQACKMCSIKVRPIILPLNRNLICSLTYSLDCSLTPSQVKGGKDAMNHHRASEGHQALKKSVSPSG